MTLVADSLSTELLCLVLLTPNEAEIIKTIAVQNIKN